MTDSICYNCGLPNPRIRARIKFSAENRFMRGAAVKTLPFCDDECALQTMFLQLPTQSSRDRIARIMHGRAIAYSEYRRQVTIDRVEGEQTVIKTPSRTRINTGAKEGKNGGMVPKVQNRVSITQIACNRLGGRPRKYASEHERKKAHARAQGAYRHRLSGKDGAR